MFLFKHMNKMIQTGNNGRGPGGPRLPSDRRRSSDDRWPEYSNGRNGPAGTAWLTAKIRSATVADGFVRLPPNDGDLGNLPRAGELLIFTARGHLGAPRCLFAFLGEVAEIIVNCVFSFYRTGFPNVARKV